MRGVIILILFISSRAFAQADYFDKYYPLIDRAEYAVTQDNFQEAIHLYSEAFKAVDRPLMRDIYNGVVCYYLSGNIDAAKPWLIILAKNGVEPAVLENQEVFQDMNIKAQWDVFKPVYVQIQSMFQATPTDDLNTLTNTIDAYVMEIRDLYDKLPDEAFDQEKNTSITKEDSLLIKKSFELVDKLYDEISFQALEYVLKNGFPNESIYGMTDEGLISDGLRGFLSNIKFYAQLHTTPQDTILGLPKMEIIKKLNDKLLEEVAKGNIHRDYVLEIIKGDYKLENLYFVRAVIPKELSCFDEIEHLFIKPKPNNDSRFFDALLGENEEMQIEKGKYALFKNELFLMNDVAIYEDVVVDSCEQFEQMSKTFIRVEPVQY